MLARQLLEYLILLGENLGVPVEHVALARLGIVGDDDHPLALIARRAGKGHLLAGQLLLDALEVGGKILVAEVDPLRVADVDRSDQLAGLFRKDTAAEVHLFLRIAVHDLFLLRQRIEEDEPNEVRVALVADHVNAGVVRVELQRSARLEDGAGVDLFESGVGHSQEVRVARVGGSQRQPQLAGTVEHPGGNLVGVLPQQLPLAGRDANFVEVVPRGVAIVEADVNQVGTLPGDVINGRAHSLRVGEVARRGHLLARRGGCRRIHGVHVEVLVSGLILHEEDVLAVATPEKGGNGSSRVGREALGTVEGFLSLLDPDVHRSIPRLAEGDELSVWRKRCRGDFRISEEQFPVDERRQARRGGLLLGRSGHHRHEHTKGDTTGFHRD